MSTAVKGRDPPPQTTASLVSGIVGDLQHLVQQQLKLTKRDIEEELGQRAAAATVLGIGVGILLLAGFEFCLTLAHLLHWMTAPAGTDAAWLPLDPTKHCLSRGQ